MRIQCHYKDSSRTFCRLVSICNKDGLHLGFDLFSRYLSIRLYDRQAKRSRPDDRGHLCFLDVLHSGRDEFLALFIGLLSQCLHRHGLGDQACTKIEPILNAFRAGEGVSDSGQYLRGRNKTKPSSAYRTTSALKFNSPWQPNMTKRASKPQWGYRPYP